MVNANLFILAKINEADNLRFSSIIDFSQKNLLLTATTISKIKSPGLINQSTIFKTLNTSNDLIINPYSSGEESENDEDPDHYPGIKDVIENIWDSNTIQQVVTTIHLTLRNHSGIYLNLLEWVLFFLILTNG